MIKHLIGIIKQDQFICDNIHYRLYQDKRNCTSEDYENVHLMFCIISIFRLYLVVDVKYKYYTWLPGYKISIYLTDDKKITNIYKGWAQMPNLD